MELMSRAGYRETALPDGKDITRWNIYQGIIDADVLINVPIVKHHSLARMTGAMKNLLGIVQSPNQFHLNLGQRVADLNSGIRSTVTVIDAVRVLMNRGPTGGNLSDVKLANTLIASTDVVAADAYAATLLGLTGDDIPVVRAASAMGLGTKDLHSISIEEIAI